MQPKIAAQTLRLVQSARSFLTEVRSLRHDMVQLAKLEMQLAASSAVTIGIFSVVTLLLAMTGWILLVGALVAWIAEAWLSLPLTLLLVVLVMLAGAVPCVLLIRSRTGDLAFRATRRQLGGLRHGE